MNQQRDKSILNINNYRANPYSQTNPTMTSHPTQEDSHEMGYEKSYTDRKFTTDGATTDTSAYTAKNEYLVKKLEDLKKINKNLATQAEKMNFDLAQKLSPQPAMKYDENYPSVGSNN